MKRLSRRMRRWLIVIAAVAVLYCLFGFFIAPMIVRAQIEKRASAALGGRAVTVAKVRINPLVFSVSVEGLRVADRDPAAGDLASWQLAYVNFDPLTSLFKWEWHLGEVRLVELKQRIAIDTAGRINVADLLGATEAAPASGKNPAPASTAPTSTAAAKLPAIGIGRLSVENWSVDFTDQSRHTPFHTIAGPMTFDVTAFTTRPKAESPYTFAGRTEAGERFAWAGTITANPFGSKGRIEFAEISLPKLMPFLEPFLDGEIRSGRVGLATDYDVVLGGEPAARLANTTCTLDDLAVARAGVDKAAIALRRVQVAMSKADVMQRTAEVTKVVIDGLDVHTNRRADGSIDLISLVRSSDEASSAATSPGPAQTTAASATASANPPATADAGPAPSVRIAEFALTDGRVSLLDLSTKRPVTATMDQIEFTLRNLSTDLDHEIAVEAKHRWAGRGTFSVSGKVRLLPFAASLDVKAGDYDLAPLDPYLEAQLDARINAGALRFAGHVEASMSPQKQLALTWSGDAGVDGLAMVDGRAGGELLAWKKLSFNGTRFVLDPLEFSAKEIALSEPFTRLAMEKDGTLNLATVLRRDAKSEGAEATKGTEETRGAAEVTAPAAKTSAIVAQATHQSLPFKAAVEAVTIEGGRVVVSDESLAPGGYTTELRDFGGAIRGLSSENVARADVDLHGLLDGVAPLRISGSINPLAEDRFSDIKVVFSNIDLPPFTPYSGRYLGSKIQKGKLRIDLAYRVSQNVLEGENRIVFDQFYLGDHVESADAIKMPIGLAIKLLRNREGQIDLDVPVRGDLDDPDFKWGRVVWQAIGNIIVKAATSPFSMLGGLLPGGKGEDLKFLDFASGSAVIPDSAIAKIEALEKALHEHPDLRLEVSSPPAPATDRAGLVEAKFAELLLAEKRAANAGAGASADNAAAAITTVAPEERDALLRRVFAQKCPAEAALVAPAANGVTPPGTAPSSSVSSTSGAKRQPIHEPGFVERMVGRVFGGGDGRSGTEPSPAAPATSAPATTGDGSTAAAVPAPGPTIEEMRLRVLATIELKDVDFQNLAIERARVVRERILAGGKAEAERVFLVEQPTVPEGSSGATEGGRVFFGLQ